MHHFWRVIRKSSTTRTLQYYHIHEIIAPNIFVSIARFAQFERLLKEDSHEQQTKTSSD